MYPQNAFIYWELTNYFEFRWFYFLISNGEVQENQSGWKRFIFVILPNSGSFGYALLVQ
jgi:hypothetical protein